MSNPPYGEQPSGHPGQQSSGYPGEQPAGFPGGQPTSKFGTDPYAAGTHGGPMAEPKKFSQLKLFTLISLAVYVVSGLPGLFGSGEAAQQEMITAAEQGGMASGEAAEFADMMVGITTAISWITLVIGIGLYLLVYFGLTKHKNWARVTGIVFAIIGVVFSVLGLASGAVTGAGFSVLALVLTLVYVAVTIYWLVLAFNSQVKAYLAQFRR